MNADDYYHIWIETIADKKFSTTNKFRYSELIAFAEAYAKQQNKELVERLESNIITFNFYGFHEYAHRIETLLKKHDK